jgi:uncharacterized protein
LKSVERFRVSRRTWRLFLAISALKAFDFVVPTFRERRESWGTHFSGDADMTDSSPNPKALVEHIAKALVAAPDQVKVDEFDEDGELVLELEVAEDDMGRVIGKSGKIARAVRNLLHVAGEKAGKRYELEILE